MLQMSEIWSHDQILQEESTLHQVHRQTSHQEMHDVFE